MTKYLLLALGGAVGTLCRYLVSNLDNKYSNAIFPLGTLLVNLSGSLLIGFLWGLSERFVLPSKFRVFALVGVLGGYTTFSAFSLESFNLLRDGEYGTAFTNVLLTNLLGISLVFAGYFLANLLLNAFHK